MTRRMGLFLEDGCFVSRQEDFMQVDTKVSRLRWLCLRIWEIFGRLLHSERLKAASFVSIQGKRARVDTRGNPTENEYIKKVKV